MLQSISTAVATMVIAGCATTAVVSDAARAELAPAGVLRAGMNLSNSLFTTKDPVTGELRGVSVDLIRELGNRLGVPVVFVVHDTPGDVADAVDKGTWDVAVLAIAQARAQTIAFSPAMTEIEATYVVHKDSALKSATQVDAVGVRIAAPEKAGYELYLTQTLQKATLIRPKGNAAARDFFNQKQADALAGLKPDLLNAMDKMPDARMLEGNFMTVNHGLTTPRARLAGAAYLKAFVEEMNAAGFIARSIVRNGVKGLSAVK